MSKKDELLEKLIKYWVNTNNSCPSESGFDDCGDCGIDCDECRRQAIEKFLREE